MLFKILIICFSLFIFNNIYAQDKCELDSTTNLNIFKKDDYKINSYKCFSDQGIYLKNYIENSNYKKLVNYYADYSAKEEPELLAVSVYKNNRMRRPILITINRSYYCCTPQIEGHMYKVGLYQITNTKKGINLEDITNILHEESEGFNGLAEGKVNYKYKDIFSIKKWLESNYLKNK
ncbi:hypothetical protein BS636_06180 [Acinetobacter sp. LoGeW2-3]|uniref:hypothetical protein n=1 Tax=Acinetobacter sp. LoGeW2-3 TaxID=1808001 RepID=UPI000C059FBD|nr:hypothetical protein [Acinetobacter sp. LoGeW2-3]ATO19278.1 hypothetical protein BS636_06180 [Acinetobacter sp. LoGeW2-3]